MFKPLQIAVLTACLLPGTALAGYVNDYEGWKKMTPERQTGYAAALVDGLVLVSDDDTKVRQEWSAAVNKCLNEKQLSSDDVADRIGAYYEAHADEQEHTPESVFLDAFLIREDRFC